MQDADVELSGPLLLQLWDIMAQMVLLYVFSGRHLHACALWAFVLVCCCIVDGVAFSCAAFFLQ